MDPQLQLKMQLAMRDIEIINLTVKQIKDDFQNYCPEMEEELEKTFKNFQSDIYAASKSVNQVYANLQRTFGSMEKSKSMLAELSESVQEKSAAMLSKLRMD